VARFSTKVPPLIEAKLNEYALNPTEKDWRLPEHREELFLRYFAWRVSHEDLDQRHWMKTLCKNYDTEQRLWFAMVFGMTYRSCQSWAYTQTFPYIHDISLEAIEDWHRGNWRRTTYGSDARYNKGHFVAQCTSIQTWLAGKTLTEKISDIIQSSDSKKNFYALFKEIKSLYKYGRMTTWLAMQAIYDLTDLPIDPGTPILDGYGPHNDSSMQSIWNGLCALTNKPEKMVGKYGGYSPTVKDVDWFQSEVERYSEWGRNYFGGHVDNYRCETIWCMYKRLFNEDASKEYAGHSSGDHAQWYLYYREHWPEIDWSLYRKAARTLPGFIQGKQIVPWHNAVFGKTGLLLNMNDMYEDLPDVHNILDLDPMEGFVKEFWTDDKLKTPKHLSPAKFTLAAPKV
jgi:hypothetical protein